MSRDSILASIRKNQPALRPLPELVIPPLEESTAIDRFITVAQFIGTRVIAAEGLEEIGIKIRELFPAGGRFVSSFKEFSDFTETDISGEERHTLENVELAILQAELGVAENSALWLPETNMMQRVLPFICQHLVLVISKSRIVERMHDAYQRPELLNPGYGAFIAGPSKTADIEQSLVLGAHGPRSLTIFLMG